MWTFFTGDDEDFKDVTYGRGAIGALLGFPAFSDALALGELSELWDLEDNEWAQLAMGYNDYGDQTNDVKFKKLANIANIQAGRTLYTTWDLASDGYLGRALTHELGIFPTKRAKEMQEKAGSITKKILPDALNEALKKFDLHKERARKRKGSGKTGAGLSVM